MKQCSRVMNERKSQPSFWGKLLTGQNVSNTFKFIKNLIFKFFWFALGNCRRQTGTSTQNKRKFRFVGKSCLANFVVKVVKIGSIKVLFSLKSFLWIFLFFVLEDRESWELESIIMFILPENSHYCEILGSTVKLGPKMINISFPKMSSLKDQRIKSDFYLKGGHYSRIHELIFSI